MQSITRIIQLYIHIPFHLVLHDSNIKQMKSYQSFGKKPNNQIPIFLAGGFDILLWFASVISCVL